MNVFLVLALLILMSYFFSTFFKFLKFPKVIPWLLFGLLIGLSGFQEFFIGEHSEIITSIGIFGIFSLMFLAGLESSWKTLVKEEKDAFYIALFSAIVPFFLAFIVFSMLGFNPIETLIIAITLSITAEGAKAQLLIELDKLKSRVGSALLGAGIIDDIFGLILFSFVLLAFGISNMREQLLLIGTIGSFVLGLLVQKFAREHHITKKIEVFLETFIIPFFFISMGLSFNLFSLSSLWWLVLVIILVAILGKLLGAFVAKRFTSFSSLQICLIGIAMNTRGAIELAIALIAFHSNLISESVYSALVLMVLITTFIFPLIEGKLIKNHKTIMN